MTSQSLHLASLYIDTKNKKYYSVEDLSEKGMVFTWLWGQKKIMFPCHKTQREMSRQKCSLETQIWTQNHLRWIGFYCRGSGLIQSNIRLATISSCIPSMQQCRQWTQHYSKNNERAGFSKSRNYPTLPRGKGFHDRLQWEQLSQCWMLWNIPPQKCKTYKVSLMFPPSFFLWLLVSTTWVSLPSLGLSSPEYSDALEHSLKESG